MSERHPDRNVLEAARGKIAQEGQWCQGSRARSATGRPVICTDIRTSPRAVSFCAEGAIVDAARETGEYGYLHFVRLLEGVCGAPLPDFNDEHSHAQVLALFDRTIRMRS